MSPHRTGLRLAVALLAALLLPGCAALERAGLLPASDDPEAAEQLVFLDRLAVAERAELASLGEELRRAADGDHLAQLRYALWLATPGHAGHDPEVARRRLEGALVESPALDRPVRALVRIQLRALRTRVELQDENARLTAENERLRAQIRALTELERRMGGSDDE